MITTKPTNIGVIGCASIADKFVIPAIKSLADQYTLTGIASRNGAKAQRFAAKFDTQAYFSYDSLLKSDQIDAVYIPLPNSMHREWIEKALGHNLHVLVEKSLACTHEEIIHLNILAKRKKLALVENFQFRFHRQLAIIKQIICDGIIGELRCLKSSFGFPPFPDVENIRYQKELGGGALLDAGAYLIKIAQYFLGDDLAVEAASLTFDPEREVDIWGGAYLKQNNGVNFAEIAFGFDNFYQCNLDLWGSKGKIYTNRIFTAPPGYAPEIILETLSGKETIEVEPDNHFENMLRYFHQIIINGTGIEMEYVQNINQGRLIEELRGKANEKQ
ncbi:MAG: Gfo/Idh/MocA family oxidoreductase [Proteobacteria bacterium]|nr:Gfo/Idh/MocA family oxidoreductase [Pseudomonadota bacterium]